jgi:hypothetical protein
MCSGTTTVVDVATLPLCRAIKRLYGKLKEKGDWGDGACLNSGEGIG